MTLFDILARDVQLELHETIAIMRAIADGRNSIAPKSAPELDQVELLSDGSVQLLGSATADDPVLSLIEMLQTLTGAASRPPQLTSLIERPPQSVEALSDALAYFERPNRELILQALYRRASGQSPLPAADELMASLRAAPVPEAADEGEKKAKASVHRRAFLFAGAAVAGVAGVVILVAFFWRDGGGSSDSAASTTLTSRVADGVTGVAGAVGSAVKSIGERAGLVAEKPPSPPVEIETATDPAVAKGVSTPARGSSKPATTVSQRTPAPISPQPAAGGLAVQGRITDRPLRAPAASAVESTGDLPDEMVYTAGTPGVSPPLGIRPHVPKEMPAGTKPADIARIELVVNPQGSVDSVKLVGQPRINDAMLLSAAKAWRFRPANKNGTPVSYRMTISVAR